MVKGKGGDFVLNSTHCKCGGHLVVDLITVTMHFIMHLLEIP